MDNGRRILYVYRTGPSRGGNALRVATAPCSAGVSPFLPEGSPVLKRIARGDLARKAPHGTGTVIIHAELATRPVAGGGETTADQAGIKRILTTKGIPRKPAPENREADAYGCRPSDILAAIAELRTQKKPRRKPSTAKTPSSASRKGHPAADALDWGEAMRLIASLRADGRPRDALLVASGCFLGLRISDLLRLRWCDLLSEDRLTIEETKTGKTRNLKVNPRLREIAAEAMEASGAESADAPAFRSWMKDEGEPISRQRAGQILKEAAARYNVSSAKVFSTHSLRKTFGRRVWLQECRKGRGEQALLLLCDVFGHSSIQITKRYLGIRQDEILSVYDALTT